MTATLDRSRLLAMVGKNWAWADDPGYIAEIKSGLAKLLEKPDEDLVGESGNNCTGGWGGVQLHVVELV